MKFDRAFYLLKYARKQLDEAYRAACDALTSFDILHDDTSLPGEDRLAAKSLRAETLEFAGKIREAMNAVPEAALKWDRERRKKPIIFGPTLVKSSSVVISPFPGNPSDSLPPLRTAARMIAERIPSQRNWFRGNGEQPGPVRESARLGHPVVK